MLITAAPERFETDRLLLRRPVHDDAAAIFARYASDADVTRYLSWLCHTSVDETHVFVGFSDNEWRRWGCGPYLACSRDDGRLLGSTGLAFETPEVASTGYVFARDAWGHGYATEALTAMIGLARAVGVRRLYAICHTDNQASSHVLEKCAFRSEGILPRHTVFPNLSRDAADVWCYARTP